MSEESLPLDAWQALVDAATPGPWVNDADYYAATVNDPAWRAPDSIAPGTCAWCGTKHNTLVATYTTDTGVHRHVHRIDPGNLWASWEREDLWRHICSASTGRSITGNFDEEQGGVASTEADAAFICAAREAMPKLIARVRELEAFIDSQESRWR